MHICMCMHAYIHEYTTMYGNNHLGDECDAVSMCVCVCVSVCVNKNAFKCTFANRPAKVICEVIVCKGCLCPRVCAVI